MKKVMEMKIAKLTLDGYFNYGNILQNYALEQVLLHYAEQVDTIWHDKNNFLPQTDWYGGWKETIKWILNWRGARESVHKKHIGYEIVRQAKNKDFCDRYIHHRFIGEENIALTDIVDEYDCFVVGSDQVWNPYYGDLSNNFLQFASQEKRISYAASIACPIIPHEYHEKYRSGLSEMYAISMREQEGADMVKRFIGRDVPVHVDPTLLLTLDEWRAVSRPPVWYRGQNYLLTYFLGPMPESVRRIASEEGLTLVNLLDVSNYEHYVTGVDEFIWAIEHASLIYTDSFHGTVFSILFRRPFVVCDRMAEHQGDVIGGKMSSRIDTLLNFFALQSRRGTMQNSYCVPDSIKIDYPDVEAVLMRERARADSYLREAMGIQ